jgi:hypothetical protein
VAEFLHFAITVWQSRPALSASCDRNEATSSRRPAPSIPPEDGMPPHGTPRLEITRFAGRHQCLNGPHLHGGPAP